MIFNYTRDWSSVAQTTRYAWVATVTLIAALVLGVLGSSYAVAANDGIQRGIDADAARYQALGEFYLAESEIGIQRGIDAGAARYQALGESYLTEAAHDMLASDPELIIARKFYNRSLLHCSVHDSLLTTNPESIFERRGRGC